MDAASTTRIGVWTMTADPVVVEALVRSGADFIGVDCQHGFFAFEQAARAIQIANLCSMTAYVRISIDQLGWVPRLLDAGADGVIAAMVEGPEDAQRVVAATRYQPSGTRSYGGQRYGLRGEPRDPRDLRVDVFAMVETMSALRSVDEIAAAVGLSGLFVGPVDLGLALSPNYPVTTADGVWQAALEATRDACHRRGLRAGNFATDGGHAAHLAAEGFDDVVVSSDIAVLRGAMREHLLQAAASAR